KVMVVGGGDSAMEEALFLTKFAEEVTVVHRRDSFRASKIMQDRVLNNKKIKVLWNTQIQEILGTHKVENVRLLTDRETYARLNEKLGLPESNEVLEHDSKVVWQANIDGIFVAIGHTPNTSFVSSLVDLD